jgi:hypothetical protein
MLDLQNIEKLTKEDLSKAINHLIEMDFNALVNLLYRVDVDEKQLKQLLQSNTEMKAGDIIADLIILRLQQKANSRSRFKQQTDVPDDEKW